MEKNSAETYTIDTGQRRSVGNAPSKVCRLDRYGGAFCMDLCIQFTTILAQMGFYVFLILKVSSIGSFHYLYNVPVTEFTG